MIQYDGSLKTERYGKKQVVLLLSLSDVYQDIRYEEIQKYGSRDVTESSLVSSRSKDGLAGRWATTFQIRNQTNFVNYGLTNLIETRKSAHQSLETGDYTVERGSRP